MEPVDIIIFWELWEQNKKHLVLKEYKRLAHRSVSAFSLLLSGLRFCTSVAHKEKKPVGGDKWGWFISMVSSEVQAIFLIRASCDNHFFRIWAISPSSNDIFACVSKLGKSRFWYHYYTFWVICKTSYTPSRNTWRIIIHCICIIVTSFLHVRHWTKFLRFSL